MKKPVLVLSLHCLLILGACSAGVVATRPPDLRYARSVSPGPSYVWVSGDWVWSRGKYHWKEGYWHAVKPGRSWKSGYWEKVQGGYRWQKGRWQS